MRFIADAVSYTHLDVYKRQGVLDAFMALGFVASKGEARRLIKQAGLKLNDKVITDENYVITEKDIENGNIKLSQGKKKHGLLVLK